MIGIEKVSIQEVESNVFPIIQRHWNEVDQRNSIQTLSPRWGLYRDLEEAGYYFALVAKKEDQYISYVSNYIQPSMHVSDSVQLVSESLFVLPEYRDKGLGLSILQSAKKVGKAMGADYWVLNLKSFQPHDNLIKGLGLKHNENVFTGVL